MILLVLVTRTHMVKSKIAIDFQDKSLRGTLHCVNRGEKGVITQGVFSVEESLNSPKRLNSLESLENGQIILCFPQSGGSLESLNSLESLGVMDFSEEPFSKRPLFPNPSKRVADTDRKLSHSEAWIE